MPLHPRLSGTLPYAAKQEIATLAGYNCIFKIHSSAVKRYVSNANETI